MTERFTTNRCLIIYACLALVTATLLFMTLGLMLSLAAFGSKEPWSLGKHLPEGTVIIEEIDDQSGMDSFFMVKAKYSSEASITEIIDEYLLQPDQGRDPQESFAGLYSETREVPWFPLPNANRTYSFTSQNLDGTQKEVTDLGYDAVLWVNDEDRIFIFQLAAL